MSIFRKYIAYGFMSFKAVASYRLAIFINFLTMIATTLLFCFLWKAVAVNSVNEGRYLIEYTVVARLLSAILVLGMESQLGKLVNEGSLVTILTRPCSIFGMLFSGAIGNQLAKVIFIVLPGAILFWAFGMLDVETNSVSILFFAISVTCAFMFTFFFEMMIGLFAFYSNSVWTLRNVRVAIVGLLSGQIIPLIVMPRYCKTIVEYLPFQTMYHVPIDILAGRNTIPVMFSMITGQIMWTVIFFLACHFIQVRAFRRMEAFGG